MIRSLGVVWLVATVGCYASYGGESDTGGRRSDGGPPITTRDGGPGRDEGPPTPPGEELDFGFRLQLVDVHRERAGGVRGADIDGRVSDVTDELGCNQEDFRDPFDGEVGVDNQLAALAPTIEAALGSDLRDSLLVIPPAPFRLEGVDPSLTDPDVRVLLADGVTRTSMRNGQFRAELAIAIPAWSFGVTPLREVGIEARLTSDGRLVDIALFGFHFLEEVIEGALTIAPDIDPELIRTTLEGVADLEPGPTGICQALSASYEAEALR